jgi:hypothetical protein
MKCSERIVLAAMSAVGMLISLATSPREANAQDLWVQRSGCATWITEGTDGAVYTAGCETTANKSLWRDTGNGWAQLPLSGTQISRFDAASMWLARANGEIRKWNGSSWDAALQIGGGTACASYIAAGPNSTVWTLGCEATADKSIWRWNGSSWESKPGKGLQVTAIADGTAFVVNSVSNSWRYTGSTWVQLPGTTNQLASGPGVNYAVLGIGDNTIYVWNGSSWSSGMGPTPGAPTKMFTRQGSTYSWAINQDGSIFRHIQIQ